MDTHKVAPDYMKRTRRVLSRIPEEYAHAFARSSFEQVVARHGGLLAFENCNIRFFAQSIWVRGFCLP